MRVKLYSYQSFDCGEYPHSYQSLQVVANKPLSRSCVSYQERDSVVWDSIGASYPILLPSISFILIKLLFLQQSRRQSNFGILRRIRRISSWYQSFVVARARFVTKTLNLIAKGFEKKKIWKLKSCIEELLTEFAL